MTTHCTWFQIPEEQTHFTEWKQGMWSANYSP